MRDIKYFAFISYSRQDKVLAYWLQKKIEHFRYPRNLVSPARRPLHKKYVRRIFIDQNELEVSSVDFRLDIENSLRNSKYFILLCSPNSAASPWVKAELEYFLKTHNNDVSLVLPVIIGGKNIDDIFSKYFEPYKRIFAVRNLPDMRFSGMRKQEDDWELGLGKILSYMLAIPYSDINDRFNFDKKLRARNATILTILAFVIIALFGAGAYWALKITREKEVKTQELEQRMREAEYERILTDEIDQILIREDTQVAQMMKEKAEREAQQAKELAQNEIQKVKAEADEKIRTKLNDESGKPLRIEFEIDSAPKWDSSNLQTEAAMLKRVRSGISNVNDEIKFNEIPLSYPARRKSRLLFLHSGKEVSLTLELHELFALAYFEPTAFSEISEKLWRQLEVNRAALSQMDNAERINTIAILSKEKQTEILSEIFSRLDIKRVEMPSPDIEKIKNLLLNGDLCFVCGFGGIDFNLITAYDAQRDVFTLKDISRPDEYSTYGTSVLTLPNVFVTYFKTEASKEPEAPAASEADKSLQSAQTKTVETNIEQSAKEIDPEAIGYENAGTMAEEETVSESAPEKIQKSPEISEPEKMLLNAYTSAEGSDVFNENAFAFVNNAVAKKWWLDASNVALSADSRVIIFMANPSIADKNSFETANAESVLTENKLVKSILEESGVRKSFVYFNAKKFASLIAENKAILINFDKSIIDVAALKRRTLARVLCATQKQLTENISKTKIILPREKKDKTLNAVVIGANSKTGEFALMSLSSADNFVYWLSAKELSEITRGVPSVFISKIEK